MLLSVRWPTFRHQWIRVESIRWGGEICKTPFPASISCNIYQNSMNKINHSFYLLRRWWHWSSWANKLQVFLTRSVQQTKSVFSDPDCPPSLKDAKAQKTHAVNSFGDCENKIFHAREQKMTSALQTRGSKSLLCAWTCLSTSRSK